ncbi:NADP-dependent oxidoreductase domain-containing protein [Ephemerocybe angulata]|uniref:NADP-dependent oxidoreductase domain-containing protein n=1 Tax=Ephemerocybe angulata TaxID=980116 RepID=A0A8H6HMK7_9AGAR|nr:NADP-dependent oxidoreductase domain-containing protein [Tulosesus angulatus]
MTLISEYPMSRAPRDACFESIKAGIDALSVGAKAFLNSGEFYARDWGTANLELLPRFFAKYSEYADRTFLSVKGAVNAKIKGPNFSMENLRASLDNIQRALGPIKEVYPVTAVEIEVSPWAYDENQKQVLEAARELGVSVIAYSPLGKGFITGQIKKAADTPEGDGRKGLTSFRDQEALKHNFAIVDALTGIAKRVGATPAQLALAWVAHLGPTARTLASRTLENLEAGDIKLSDEDFAETTRIIDEFEDVLRIQKMHYVDQDCDTLEKHEAQHIIAHGGHRSAESPRRCLGRLAYSAWALTSSRAIATICLAYCLPDVGGKTSTHTHTHTGTGYTSSYASRSLGHQVQRGRNCECSVIVGPFVFLFGEVGDEDRQPQSVCRSRAHVSSANNAFPSVTKRAILFGVQKRDPSGRWPGGAAPDGT